MQTYGIPSISKLLVQTTQLSTAKNAGKRYQDTAVLLVEILGTSHLRIVVLYRLVV